MTVYKDNIYSGNIATTSSNSSMSPVVLTKSFSFNAATGSTTLTGTFPPNAQNLSAELFITQQGSATTHNQITISAGGTNLIVIDQFGSATGYAPGVSVAALARFTITASACQNIPVPSPANNGGEIPFSVTFLKDAGDPSGACTVSLYFNRADTTWGPQGPYTANTFV